MIDILQRLEDRVINLVDELESLRTKLAVLVQENHHIKAENQHLKARSESEQEKLSGILNLLDGVDAVLPTAHQELVEEFEESVA